MTVSKYFSILVVLFLVTLSAYSQDKSGSGWLRVQTDDGKFSVEVPDDYSYFFNKDGFGISREMTDYVVRDVSILSAYRDGTLVSFEVYRANAGALEALAAVSVPRDFKIRKSKLNGIPVREIVKSDDKSHFVSYYFRSDNHIYIVSSASRSGETSTMKRFFESLRLTEDSKMPAADAEKLSSLTIASVSVQMRTPSAGPSVSPVTPTTTGPAEKPLLIVSKVRATYLDRARMNSVQGAV